MSVVTEQDEALRVKKSLSELKTKRRELERQLTGAGVPVSDDTAAEGKIKKLLGSFYQAPPSAPIKPNREQLEAEIEALSEAIARLRNTYHDAKGKAEDERVSQLMPSYREAVIDLRRAIDEAARCNEVVGNLEAEMGYRSGTLTWIQLIPPGWLSRITLSQWRQRVELFLNSR